MKVKHAGKELSRALEGHARHVREKTEEFRDFHCQISEILETIQDGFFSLDRNWRFTYVNWRAAEIVGLSPEQIIGRNIWESYPQILGTEIEKSYQKVMQERMPFHFEHIGIGSDIWFEIRVYPAGNGGISIYWIDKTEPKKTKEVLQQAHEDLERQVRERTTELQRSYDKLQIEIEEHQRAEEALKKSREEYKHIIQYAPSAIYEIDFGTSKFMSVNDVMCTISGYTEAEFFSMNLFSIMDEESRQKFQERTVKILSGEKIDESVEYKVTTKNGREIWLVLYMKMVYKDEKTVRALVVGYDITERKKVEEALRKSEERQSFLIRFGDALRLLNNQITIHAEASRMLGEHLKADRAFYSDIDEDEGTTFIRADYFREGLASLAGCHSHADFIETPTSLCSNQPFFMTDTQNSSLLSEKTRAAFDALAIRAFASVPLVKDDKLIRTLNVISNTVRIWTADEVALVREVAERTWAVVERAQVEDELRKANKQKDDFLAVLSHELRNPLAVIQNNISILDRAKPEGVQEKRAKEVINRQIGQLSRLVDDLLDITRINQNKIKLQRQQLELGELVRRSVEDHRPLFERNGVCLEIELPPVAILINGDEARLTQVVGNLLLNAAKFTNRSDSARISLIKDSSRQQAIICVIDTGIGIEPELISSLFQPFMQADTSLDRNKSGLGLGLALSKGLIELHGGDISIKSAGLGKGSEFIVRLPLDNTNAEEPQDSPEKVPHRNRRVLIIDDNLDLARSLFELLALCEHEVAVAYDGFEGLKKAREFNPEVVLCDIGLPGMDGYEVARAFRADQVLKNVFLVALTGYAQSADQVKAANAGFERLLAKPVGLDALERMLAEMPVKISE